MGEYFSCVKCGYSSDRNKEHFGKFFCEVCNCFIPEKREDFEKYAEEKIDKNVLEIFRKYSGLRGEKQKTGMIKKASKGNIMSRAAFGYRMENGKLIPSENYLDVEKIFKDFLNSEISLTQLAKRYGLSINGLKKILRNFTYIGKIKFNNQIHEGSHTPLISSTLFNHVQNKMEKLGIKRS